MNKIISPVYKNKRNFVRKHLDNPHRLLDIGCGEGNYFEIYRENSLNFVGVDRNPEMLNPENCICANAEKLPLTSNIFDAVVCIDVLEHIENDVAAIMEIRRVLKRNGILLISVPNFWFPFSYDPLNAVLRIFNFHFPIGIWDWGHRRLYRKGEIEKLLAQEFEIIHFEHHSHFLVGLFVNYIPYITVNLIMPFIKRKKKATHWKWRIPKSTYKFFDTISNLDRRFFSWSQSINLCYVCKKR